MLLSIIIKVKIPGKAISINLSGKRLYCPTKPYFAGVCLEFAAVTAQGSSATRNSASSATRNSASIATRNAPPSLDPKMKFYKALHPIRDAIGVKSLTNGPAFSQDLPVSENRPA